MVGAAVAGKAREGTGWGPGHPKRNRRRERRKNETKKNATSTEMNQVEKPPPSRTGISKASRFYATMKLFCREMLDVGSEGEKAGRTPSVLS